MEPEQLQRKIAALKREKRIHDSQNKLFKIFITMAQSSNESQLLNVTMQKALEIITRFSGAQKGGLFLLDINGRVTDSILTRDQIKGERRSNLIGKVLDKGLAGWVKNTLSVGLVTDTKTDDRWVTLPNQPYRVRSALAVPVRRNGSLFGIITLMHPEPSHFNLTSVGIVQYAADQMAIVLENAKLYKKLEELNRSLENARQSMEKYSRALDAELEKGRKIQEDFLPHSLPEVKNCDIAACLHSALQLSGDFYDVFELPNKHITFIIADVSDKGIGSALFMALTRSLLRIFSRSFCIDGVSGTLADIDTPFQPGQALKAVSLINEYLAKEHGSEGMFVTLFFGVLDGLTGSVAYINGGHEPVLVLNKGGIKKALKPTGPALGPIQGAVYKIETIQLEPGDILFGFTDGVTEARSEKKGIYTRNRLENLINTGVAGSVDDLLRTVKTDLFAFVDNAPQSDDITMLAVKWQS